MGSAQQHLEQVKLGVALREMGKIDEAEAALRKALAMSPRSQHALFELAHTLAVKKSDREAMRVLMQLIKAHPDFIPAYVALAGLYRFAERIDDAIKICHQCLSVNQDALEVGRLLKDLYMQKGDMAAAIQVMNQICDRRGTAEDYLEFGHLAFTAEQFELSEKAYKWARALAPETWKPHLGLAELYEKTDRIAEAEREFDLAIRINRDSYEPHNDLAIYFVKRDRIDAAIKHLNYACKLAPNEPTPRYNLGLVLAKANKLPEAREALRLALEQTPAGEFHDQIVKVLTAVEREMGAS